MEPAPARCRRWFRHWTGPRVRRSCSPYLYSPGRQRIRPGRRRPGRRRRTAVHPEPGLSRPACTTSVHTDWSPSWGAWNDVEAIEVLGRGRHHGRTRRERVHDGHRQRHRQLQHSGQTEERRSPGAFTGSAEVASAVAAAGTAAAQGNTRTARAAGVGAGESIPAGVTF